MKWREIWMNWNVASEICSAQIQALRFSERVGLVGKVWFLFSSIWVLECLVMTFHHVYIVHHMHYHMHIQRRWLPLFFENKWGKKRKKSANFGRFRSFLFTILAQLRLNFTQVCLWFCFNLCDLYKVCLILSTFRFDNYMYASHVPSTCNCAKVRTFTYCLVCYYVYWTGWNNFL